MAYEKACVDIREDAKAMRSADADAEAPKATSGAKARVRRAPGTLARKALSVVMSVMLVLTMNPFTGAGAAIATGANDTPGGGQLKASLTPL